MVLLGIDTEGGGLELEYSLLTLNMVVYNDQFKKLSELDLKLKPDDGMYKVNAEALEINRIDLVEHSRTAITYKSSKTVIYNWLNEMYNTYGLMTPFGQAIQRDEDLIHYYTLSKNTWQNFVDRRCIDTVSISKFLQLIGKLDSDQSLSLSNLAEYLGVEIDEHLVHTAAYDVELGAELLKKQIKLVKK